MKQADVIDTVTKTLWPDWKKQADKLDVLDLWYRWEQEPPQVPRGATKELKYLIELSRTPWCNVVVTTIAQALYADGYRNPKDRENTAAWDTWQANDLDWRQSAIYRACLAYGLSYATVLPGVDADGKRSVIRGVSPRRMTALYQDPAEDDWPMYAMRVIPQGGPVYHVRMFDETNTYRLSTEDSGATFKYIDDEEHKAGVCPVVRYTNLLDLEGRADGEVAPLISVVERVNKTVYDRLLVQHFASWRIITVAGMVQPTDEEAADRAKLKMRQDQILIADDPDTKFDTLDASPLDGFIKAHDSDLDDLSGASQVPITSFTGQPSNLAADALALLRAGLDAKCAERKMSFGKSDAQALRLAMLLEGKPELAGDFNARMTWQDVSVRSLAQAADALGKLSTMLGIPPQALWSWIPGVTQADTDDFKAAAAEQTPLDVMTQALLRAGNPTPGPADAALG